ncbi:ATP-binding protein [Desulfolithobacter sp.]
MSTSAGASHSIIKKILVPFGFSLVTLLVLFVVSLVWLQRKHIDTSVDKQVHAARELFDSFMNRNSLLMDDLLRIYAENQDIARALRYRDREHLTREFDRIYHRLRHDTKIESIAFLDRSGKILYLSHKPEKFGQTLYHFNPEQENLRPETISSKVVIGLNGRLKLRLIAPVFEKDQLVGYIAQAKELTAITREINTILEVDLVFLAPKSILQNRRIKRIIETSSSREPSSGFSTHILLASTMEQIPPAVADGLDKVLSKQPRNLFTFKADGKFYAGKSVSLINRDGSYISDIVILDDITQEKNRLYMVALLLAGLATLLGLVLFGLLYRHTRRIQERLLATRSELQDEIEQRKKAEKSLHDINATLSRRVRERTRELQKTNQELQDAATRFQTVMDSLDALVYVADMETYEILFINRFGTRIWGDITGTICWQTLQSGQDGPCEFCTNKYLLNEDGTPGPTHVWEHQNLSTGDWFECRDQAIHWTDGRIVRLEIATIINRRKQDEKEKKSLQSQLIQAQKMESIGRFTGGIAHDFNNFLSPIIGYCELLLMRNDLDPAVQKKIESIQSAGRKASHLVEQLLALSRRQVLQIEVLDLNSILHDMIGIFNRIIGEDISIELHPQDNLGKIKGDRGQIEQIVMNLAVNARDAMSEGGKLIFETGTVSLDENYTSHHPEIHPGTYVMLCVTDNGKGIPRDIMERIFDPFFTTKKPGKGTGLGLATVYGIVKQHRGHIFVYSEPETGTTFKIYFPMADDEEDSFVSSANLKKEMPGGRETILVVDDEESIRQLLTDTLSLLGYTVFTAESGEDAEKLVQDTKPDIDLLLTDVIMPGMNGKELASSLKNIYPDLKIMFISGYTDNLVVKHGVLEPGIELLSKPVLPTVLAARIRNILDR